MPSWLYKIVNCSCLLFPAFPKNPQILCFSTCAGQVQFSLAKPQLGSVNSAGVELNSEHHLPLCCSTPPMVALHLKTLTQENDHFTLNVSKKVVIYVDRCDPTVFIIFICFVVLLCFEAKYVFTACCCCGN